MILSKAVVANCSSLAARYYICFVLKEHKDKLHFDNGFNFQQQAYLTIKTKIPLISNKDTIKSNKWKILRKTFLEYGIVGSIFHISTSFLLFGSCYYVVTQFGEIEGVLEKFHSLDTVYAAPGLNFIITLGIFKSLFPLRMGCTGIGTWSIVKYYRCRKAKKQEIILANEKL